ncbi:MAG: YqjK-like family protein [Gallionellaceae bacterium]|nr:YqjK-like family protein [Gallionellaceae bacterium]
MNNQKLSMLQRRHELLAKIALQRKQLAEIGKHWQAPVAAMDKGLSVIRFFRSHPVLLAGAVALLVMRRHSLAGLLKNAGQLWKGYRYLLSLSAKLLLRN